MIEPPLPPDESRRIAALRRLGILDTPADERFDRITRTAMRLFDTPIALVTLVDTNRQWFKSCQGLTIAETPRSASFCAHAILEAEPLVIPDALEDPRFADNPLVIGEPYIRFYVGCPLVAADGSRVGTLCVIDRRPRAVSPADLQALRDLAAWAETELSLIHSLRRELHVQRRKEARSLARRQRAEEALRKTEDRYRRLIEQVPAVIYTAEFGADGPWHYVSPQLEALLGFSQADWLSNSAIWHQQLHPEDRERVLAAEADSRGGGRPFRIEYRMFTRAGDSVWVRDEAVVTYDAAGRPAFLQGFMLDITERKRAEATLHQQHQYLAALHETTLALMNRLELGDLLQTIVIWAARLVDTQHGYVYLVEPSRDSIEFKVGVGAFDKYVGYRLKPGEGLAGKVWQTKQTVAVRSYASWPERASEFADGTFHAVVGVPLVSGSQVVGVIGMAHVDADRSFSDHEVELLSRFAQLASIALDNARLYEETNRFFTLSPDLVCIAGVDGYFKRLNPAWQHIIGIAADELLAQPLIQFIHPADRDASLGHIRMLLAGAESVSFENRFRRADGSYCWLLWNATLAADQQMIYAIAHDITERKQVELLKNEFIATVSHELRTPLTSIRGSLGLLSGGAAGELLPRAKTMIDIAYKNSERLVRLINDILDIEKIESGKLDFIFKPVALDSLLEQAVEANRAYGAQFRVAFRLEPIAPEIMVNVDADRFIQVITNLLSNAAKFSPRGETVLIAAARVGGQVRITIADRGPGIPDDFRARVFQKFAQADSSDTRQKGGTGLGLSISQAIVERLGGQIGFESQVGVGTTFCIELPEWREALPQPEPIEPPRPPRILVCEDNPDIATLLTMMLARSGFDTDVAHDAASARLLLAQKRYAGMTLDMILPDQDGVTFIRDLRAAEHTRDLPIVVVSAMSRQGRARLFGDGFGIVDWLSKPIDGERLVQAVQRAVGQPAGPRPRILHVEDDPDVAQVVSALLQDSADIAAAASLEEARARLGEEPFELVILDLDLPDGSGLSVLPYLHGKAGSPIPVVIFSIHEVDAATAERVAATLVKSRTSNQELVATISALIGHKLV